jgi:hypothetical protein
LYGSPRAGKGFSGGAIFRSIDGQQSIAGPRRDHHGSLQRIAGSQNPPKQKSLQQSPLVVHFVPTSAHAALPPAPVAGLPPTPVAGLPPAPVAGGGCFVTHLPLASHIELQQSTAPVQAAPSAAQGVLQTPAVHAPRQQSLVALQATPSAKQVSAPNAQRFVSLLHSLQQPRPEPEVQSSPVGRQSRFTRSTAQRPPSQLPEQQSAFVLHESPSTVHIPPHTPPWHPVEQQSSAFSHATPSAKHALRHTSFATPVTGSQRPLWHSAGSLH